MASAASPLSFTRLARLSAHDSSSLRRTAACSRTCGTAHPPWRSACRGGPLKSGTRAVRAPHSRIRREVVGFVFRQGQPASVCETLSLTIARSSSGVVRIIWFMSFLSFWVFYYGCRHSRSNRLWRKGRIKESEYQTANNLTRI